jgi:hypothetical protein
MPINSPLLSRRLIDRVGFFNEDLRATEDWEYWIRCAVAGANFLYSDTPHTYALVRKHERSTTATHTLLMLKDSLRVRIWAVHLVHDPTTRHTLRAIVHDKRIAMREFEVQQGRLFVSTIALATAQLRARRYRAALRSFLLLAALPLLPPTTVRALLVGQESLRRLVSTLPGAPRRNR